MGKEAWEPSLPRLKRVQKGYGGPIRRHLLNFRMRKTRETVDSHKILGWSRMFEGVRPESPWLGLPAAESVQVPVLEEGKCVYRVPAKVPVYACEKWG